jgi:hypothetical protein
MLRIYAPAAVALAAIAVLTYFEAGYSDRFESSSVTAEDFGRKFANVPKVVGPWEGVDMKEEAETLKMAGAVRHVSRRYTNRETGQSVDLWLIVGHSRDVCRHTPDICYPSHGISQVGARVIHTITPPTDPDHPATFFTAKFNDESSLGRTRQRVFWAWNGNEEGKDEWEAPEAEGLFGWLPIKSSGPKTYYGNNPALYKMYFTAAMGSPEEPPEDNLAIDFAELMLPAVNRALFPEHYGLPADAAAAGEAAAEAAEDAAAEAGEAPAANVESTPAGE